MVTPAAAQVENTKSERRVLEIVNHPFIVSLHYAFEVAPPLSTPANKAAIHPANESAIHPTPPRCTARRPDGPIRVAEVATS